MKQPSVYILIQQIQTVNTVGQIALKTLLRQGLYAATQTTVRWCLYIFSLKAFPNHDVCDHQEFENDCSQI